MVAPEVDKPHLRLGAATTREHIIRRARSWLEPAVPYDQSGFHENEYGIYRTDCSGYISMAWGIPGKPPNRHGGLDTRGLAASGFAIGKPELLPGDVLLRAEGTNLTRHVTLFEEWVNDDHYWGCEQAGGIGTVRRIIRYPYEKESALYLPFRYLHII
ncbi:hypothetical protein AB5J62_30335 [Amycolatopsis sp. cg5]|uniref:hypothetical protein n=1 Tax=Amycolatopsis sp. cg5 TaxID=3238802 RepID=UPI003523DA3A